MPLDLALMTEAAGHLVVGETLDLEEEAVGDTKLKILMIPLVLSRFLR